MVRPRGGRGGAGSGKWPVDALQRPAYAPGVEAPADRSWWGKGVVALLLLLVAFHMPAAAGLIGTSVTVTYNYPDLSTVRDTNSYVVGTGIEIDCTPPLPPFSSFCGVISTPFTLDLGDSLITYRYGAGLPSVFAGPAAFNGFVFSGLNLGAPITGVTLTTTGFAGLDQGDVSFTANSVAINLQGASEVAGDGWSIAIQTTPIPEPGTGGLALAALAGLGAASALLRRRRRNNRG